MRILFLAPTYLDLQKDIISEMERQGHEVVFIADRHDLPFDYGVRPTSFPRRVKRIIKQAISSTLRIRHNYWAKLIKREELSRPFDFLLCINGSSFHPSLIKHLKAMNPAVRSCIYVWDTNTYRDFFHSIKYFDKAFSFDLNDCKSVEPNIPFLPFYWLPSSADKADNKYDISMIGSAHGHRVKVLSEVLKQLKDYPQVRQKFHIYSPNHLDKIDEQYQIHTPLPPAQVNSVIASSGCILDTSREGQGGTTPRFIWALAQGKKIITTNSFITGMPFYRADQIRIIDAENPVVDVDFILSDKKFEVSPYIENLRIDRWVKTLLLQ